MKVLETTDLTDSQKSQLLILWNSEYQDHLGLNGTLALDTYLEGLTNVRHFLLSIDDEISAWAWTFDRDDERWFAIIISESVQGIGLGRKMMDHLKQSEETLNGWVTDHEEDKRSDGRPYKSPLPFYIKNGFEVIEDQRLLKGALNAVKIRYVKHSGN